jgi:hypothetical protein
MRSRIIGSDIAATLATASTRATFAPAVGLLSST